VDYTVYDGLMTLEGSDTFFHNNVTFADTVGTARGGVHYYGLHTSSSSTLRLVLPLTIGNISRKNGGGGNFGGTRKGRIVSYNKDIRVKVRVDNIKRIHYLLGNLLNTLILYT